MVTASRTIKQEFDRQGFVKVEGVLDPKSVLDPIIEEYHGVLDRLANELFADGKISSPFSELAFDERLIKIYQESGQAHNQYFDFSLPFSGVKPDTPFWAGWRGDSPYRAGTRRGCAWSWRGHGTCATR